MHLPHRAARADKHRHAARPQVAAIVRLAIGGGDIRPWVAQVGGVIVVDAAHVDLRHAVQRRATDQVERSAPGDQPGQLAGGIGRARVEHDNVVEAQPSRQLFRQGGIVSGCQAVALDNLGLRALNQRAHAFGHIGQHDRRGRAHPFRERIHGAVAGSPDDPHHPTGLRCQTAALAVGAFDAGPWLGERGLGVAELLANRQDIRALIGVEHLGAEQLKLDQTAGDRVAIGRALALLVDIRLDREALAGLVLVAQVRADLKHRERGLVAEPGWLGRQVAVVELRVLAALLDQLDIREAQAHRIHAHQQLIVAGFGHREALRLAVASDLIKARTIHVPCPGLVRDGRVGRAVIVKSCGHRSFLRAPGWRWRRRAPVWPAPGTPRASWFESGPSRPGWRAH